MRRLVICTALALWLVAAGPAAAKEPVKAKVCGVSDCRTVKDKDTLMALTEGGPPSDPPRHGAAWYSVRTTIAVGDGQRDSFTTAIVPSAGLMRGSDAIEGYVWMPATARGKRAYRRVTRGLAPRPAGTLKGVGPPKARVDEVVLPHEQASSDGATPLPWIAGAVALLGAAGLLIRRRWRPSLG
jgi:hypothetical protein